MGMERTGYNNLTLEIYNAFSTTRVTDADNDLFNAEHLKFETMYPGGLFAVLTFTVIRDPNRSWPIKQGQRLVARNGLTVVWEGRIISPGYQADADSGSRSIMAIGCWGAGLLGAVGQRKPWCDMRLTEDAWPLRQTNRFQQVDDLRNGVIRLVPRDNLRWDTTNFASVRYTAPTGQLIRRIKYDYDFSEDAAISPSIIFDFNGVSTYTDLTNAYDGDTTTGVTVSITTAHAVYIGVNQDDADKIKAGQTVRMAVTMGATKNSVNSVLSAEYWSDTAGAWTALTISDGTASGGKTLAQSGTITYTKPGDMGKTPIGDANKNSKIWVRLKVSVNLTSSININEITYGIAQDWYIVVSNVTAAAEIAATKVSATGTGSIDNTLATPSSAVDLLLRSNSQQTPFGNGSIYGQFANIRVYADANTISASEIVLDWATFLSANSSLNADTSNIATNNLVLEPWITGDNLDFEMAASNLARVAALGDASFNAWACYVLEAERARSYDGKPVLAYQRQPALTDYDYAISLEDAALQSLSLSQTQVYNDIIVTYTDANGVAQTITSADDAGLTDAASVGLYGKFQSVQNMGQVSSIVAVNLGKRYLAQSKDVHFYVTDSIPVTGYILGKNKNPVPATEVHAGNRIKVMNFLTDEVGTSGAGLTFIITHTAYDDDSETVNIDCDTPDNLGVILARIAQFSDHWSTFHPWQQF